MNRAHYASGLKVSLPKYRIGKTVLVQDVMGSDHWGEVYGYCDDEMGSLMYEIKIGDNLNYLYEEELDEHNEDEI